MAISKKEDIKLKIGNLFLAGFLSIVPTGMTIAFLGVHGRIVCSDLGSSIEKVERLQIIETCNKSNLDTVCKYIIWIWLFITIPTWRWFYVGHYKRQKSKKTLIERQSIKE